jgi:2',3'-cyclic-nucleotide 2'-phosphodiesterase
VLFRNHTVVGTHTHVPIADDHILSGGTAYVSDVGMTGGKESIIGFDKEDFLGLFLERGPARIGVPRGPAVLNVVVIEAEVESHRAVSIERVYGEYP